MADPQDQQVQAALALLQALGDKIDPQQKKALLELILMSQKQGAGADVLNAAASMAGTSAESFQALLQDPQRLNRMIADMVQGSGAQAGQLHSILRSAGIQVPRS